MAAEARLEDFPLRTYDKLRYADTDKQGHVNNAVYSTFYETGRVEFIEKAREAGGAEAENSEFVIAQITVQYLRETHWPANVDIGSRVKRIGNTSLVVEQGLFVDGELKSRAESVVVQIDTETRKPAPFRGAMRAFLETLVVTDPSATGPAGSGAPEGGE
ncbi:thioesterase family protein [Brevibacterium samyangense]|uniref:Thioesterase family protein n=1 Tax=Brevibacterium samyangense TaxID=366888 RepID=A0ABN2THE8_9MICO